MDIGGVMALNLKNPETHELARKLAERLDTTMAEAVHRALEDALRSIQVPADVRADRLREIADHCAALPVRDARPPEEILGYDERGLPT